MKPVSGNHYHLRISGWRVGAETISAIRRLCDSGRYGLVSAKQAIEAVLDGDFIIIENLESQEAESLAKDLDEFGFNVSFVLLWCFGVSFTQ